jgi:hypothetical protein
LVEEIQTTYSQYPIIFSYLQVVISSLCTLISSTLSLAHFYRPRDLQVSILKFTCQHKYLSALQCPDPNLPLQVIDAEGLGLTLIGVGGITSAEHVLEMLAAGAHVVQSATGMMWNPHLALEFRDMYTACKQELLQQQEQQQGVRAKKGQLVGLDAAGSVQQVAEQEQQLQQELVESRLQEGEV